MSNNLPKDEHGKCLPFAWPGGYDIAYYLSDGTVLCSDCADKALESDWDGDKPTMADGMQDSDSCETCEDCGKLLSAYCSLEDDGTVDHNDHCSNHLAPPHESLTWHSSLYGFSLTLTRDQAQSVSGPGPADENVAALALVPAVAAQLDAIDPELIRRELRESGGWEDDQLSDDHANRERLLWIVGCELMEEEKF